MPPAVATFSGRFTCGGGTLRYLDYQLGLLTRVTLGDGTEMDLWAARDALVCKALALVLGPVLRVSLQCTHYKGHGGLKATVRDAQAQFAAARYVFKTDVRSYDASIDHHRLLALLGMQIRDRRILTLIGQYLIRRAERGGPPLADESDARRSRPPSGGLTGVVSVA